MIISNYPRCDPRYFIKMEIITLSEMEINYHGEGGYKFKHNIQLVFTSESFQLFMTFCCDLPEAKCIFKTAPAIWTKGWSHIIFQDVLSTCKVCREILEGVYFCVSSQWRSFPCNPRVDYYFSSELVEDHVRSLLGGKDTCWNAVGFQLITSRPSLDNSRGYKRIHTYGEPRECGEEMVQTTLV